MVRAVFTGALALTESKKKLERTLLLREGGRQGISPAYEARQRAIGLKVIGNCRMEKKGDCSNTKTFLLPKPQMNLNR